MLFIPHDVLSVVFMDNYPVYVYLILDIFSAGLKEYIYIYTGHPSWTLPVEKVTVLNEKPVEMLARKTFHKRIHTINFDKWSLPLAKR